MAAHSQKDQEVPSHDPPEGIGKNPVHMISYNVGKDTLIEASIWERTMANSENSFNVHYVSVHKRMKMDDEGKPEYSFRGSELPYVILVLDLAEAWIAEQCKKDDVPF